MYHVNVNRIIIIIIMIVKLNVHISGGAQIIYHL